MDQAQQGADRAGQALTAQVSGGQARAGLAGRRCGHLDRDAAGGRRLFEKNPEGWYSAAVLDDLLLAARDRCMNMLSRPVVQAARRLAGHAMAVLRVLVGDGPHTRLEWAETDHRPVLCCLALAVELCRIGNDERQALALMQWGLRLNPNDNHGWRALVAPMLIENGRPDEALALLERYPDDLPPSEHARALALFALDRRDEAEAVLRAAHQAYPLFLEALWPDAMFGARAGRATGWRNRCLVFSDGVAPAVGAQRCAGVGARAGTARPAAPAQARWSRCASQARAQHNSQPAAAGHVRFKTTFGPKEEKRLAKTCSDVPRLHGLLTAVTWSPQMLMPSTWLPLAMALHDRMPNSRTSLVP